MAIVQNALTLVVTGWTFLGVATITLALRFYVRIFLRHAVGIDDWLLLSGLILFAVDVIVATLGAVNGLGVHNYGASAAEMEKGVMYLALWQIFYVVSTTPIKASVCASLIRISPQKNHRRVLYALIAASIISTIIALVVVFTMCRPMACTWDKTIEDCKCGTLENVIMLSYVVSAVNIVTDWTCAVMPAVVLWSIQLPTRQKAMACIIMSMGIVASSATLVRLKTIPLYRNTNDYLYGVAEVAIWSMPEVGLGIIAASAATYRPLFSFLRTRTESGGYSSRPSRTAEDGARKGSNLLNSNAKYGIQTTVVGYEQDIELGATEDSISQRGLIKPGERHDESGIMVRQELSLDQRSEHASSVAERPGEGDLKQVERL